MKKIFSLMLLFNLLFCTSCAILENPEETSLPPIESQGEQPNLESNAPEELLSYSGVEVGMEYNVVNGMVDLQNSFGGGVYSGISGKDYDVLIEWSCTYPENQVVKIYKINHSAEPTNENIQKLTKGMTIPETCHIIGLPNGSRTSGLVSIYYDLLDGRKLTIYGVKTIDSIQLD